MRKTTLLITIAALVTIAACTKEKKNIIPPTTDDDNNDTPVVIQPVDTNQQPNETGIVLKGIGDINVGLYGSRFIDMQVECDSCFGEQISLEVTGAPKNVEMGFTNTLGNVGFTTTLSTKSRFTKPGTYPIQVVARSSKGKKKTYDIKMIIDTPSHKDCNGFFVWAFDSGIPDITLKTVDSMVVDSLIDNITFARINHEEDNLYFSRLIVSGVNGRYDSYNSAHPSYHVRLYFDCSTNKVTIPKQYIEGIPVIVIGTKNVFTIEGSGQINLTKNTYDIEYTSSYNNGTTFVTETFLLSKKLREL